MANNDVLIGFTGFVGSNLLRQHSFSFLYNSKNIEEIQNKNFGLLVCAGAPGTKWIANKEPENDLASIEKLMTSLKLVKCEKFVLISTIDVYSPVNGVNEDSTIDAHTLQPYAKHRRMLEEFARTNFNSLVIRLPGLFGSGLKKNVIFDLLHGKTENASPESLLQFYNLNYIWADVTKALNNNLQTLNIATEPITLKDLAKTIFNLNLEQSTTPPAQYDMHTKNAPLWGIIDKPYLYSQDKVLEDLKKFVVTSSPGSEDSTRGFQLGMRSKSHSA